MQSEYDVREIQLENDLDRVLQLMLARESPEYSMVPKFRARRLRMIHKLLAQLPDRAVSTAENLLFALRACFIEPEKEDPEDLAIAEEYNLLMSPPATKRPQ